MDIDNIALQAALVTGVFVVLYLSLASPAQDRTGARLNRCKIESAQQRRN